MTVETRRSLSNGLELRSKTIYDRRNQANQKKQTTNLFPPLSSTLELRRSLAPEKDSLQHLKSSPGATKRTTRSSNASNQPEGELQVLEEKSYQPPKPAPGETKRTKGSKRDSKKNQEVNIQHQRRRVCKLLKRKSV